MRVLVALSAAVLVLIASCSQDRAKHETNRAGQAIGEGATSFFNGLEAGAEKTVTSYDVRLSGELKAAGVSVTIARSTTGDDSNGHKPGLSFYVLNKSPITGILRLKLFNSKDQEIGRAVTSIGFTGDDARYVPFTLDKLVPVVTTKYVELDLKK
jgi:hypothetical protein